MESHDAEFSGAGKTVARKVKTGSQVIISVTFIDEERQRMGYSSDDGICTVRLGDVYPEGSEESITQIDVDRTGDRYPTITFMRRDSVTVLPDVKMLSYYARLYV